MAEEAAAIPPEVVQGNEPAARTETGEIKDQQTTQTVTTPSETKLETKTEPSTETKTEGDKKAADTPVVPEKYEFKAPEGTQLDDKAIEAVTPIFKELGLTQDQANKLFAFQAAREAEAAKIMTEMRADWRDKIIKDSTIGDGREGLKPEVKANIARAIDSVGDTKAVTALKEALDLTGAGDHPAIVAAFNTLGKLLSEGTAVKAGGAAPVKTPNSGPRNAAQALFPNLPSSANP